MAPQDEDKMKLYMATASPFARKVRILVRELKLTKRVEEIAVSPMGNDELRRVNPLGKIPALVLDDGSTLFDSRVICEYLNEFGGGKFFPGMSIWRSNSGRWRALALQALADGICDAAVARVYESRRPEPEQSAETIARYLQAVTVGVDALERGAARFPNDPTIGEVATACALGYLDFRLADLGWRNGRPKLAAWYEGFQKYPSVAATAPENAS